MIHYKDKTFCDSDCTNEACYRYLSNEDELGAKKCGLLIAFCDYSKECQDYEGGWEYGAQKKYAITKQNS